MRDPAFWGDVVGGTLLLLGCLLTLVTALGLARFPDLFARMHAATKPQVLGLMLTTSGLSLILWDARVTLTLMLVVAFQLITAPIAAHMLGRAGYRSERVDKSHLILDEYTEDVERVSRDLPPASQ